MTEADNDRINDPDVQVDNKIIKLAEEYNSLNQRSKDLSDDRKTIRENVEKLGIHPLAWQHAVKLTKDMTDGERRDYQVGMNRVLKVIGERAGDLFPEDVERTNKRAERKAERAAKDGRTQAELDAKTDTDPKSDPKKGGAGKGRKKKDEPAADTRPPEMRSSDPVVDASLKGMHDEQAEGEAALNAGLTETRSQSQKAKDKLEKLGVV